jgi:glycosyltransferase involved in cell wall biosynthesis
VPYVISARGTLRHIAQRFTGKKVFDLFFGRTIFSGASAFIAISKDEMREYNSLGLKKKVYHVPNGIDVKTFSKAPKKGLFRKKYGLGKERLLLFMGRISMRKGVHHVAKAIKDIDCKFAIVGKDDGYLNEVKKVVNKFNLHDKVLLPGFLSGEMKLAALNDGDVFVYPSRYEAFGISIIEALAFNKPVVIGDDCGIRDFVLDNNFGFPVGFGDIGAIKNAIKNSFKLRISSRKKVFETFSWERIAKQMESVYGEVIGNR